MTTWDAQENLQKLSALTKALQINDNQWEGHCPLGCGKNDKKTFYFNLARNAIQFICHRCNDRQSIFNLIIKNGIDLRPSPSNKTTWAQDLWASSHYEHEKVNEYFINRGLKPIINDEIKFHPNSTTKSNGWDVSSNVIVLRMKNSLGNFTGVQRIFIENGKPTKLGKRILGKTSYVQFDVPTDVLGIAEGPETALAVRQVCNLPIWCTINAGEMSKFVAPHEVKRLFIFCDVDPNGTGEKAAIECAKNNPQIECFIVYPKEQRTSMMKLDFLDILNNEGEVRILEQFKKAQKQKVGFALMLGQSRFEPMSTVNQNEYGDFKWFIDEMLQTDGVAIFSGKPKCGKSTLVRQLMLCSLMGKPWLGRQVTPKRIMYFAFEEHIIKVKQHLNRMAGNESVPWENMFVHCGLVEDWTMEELERIVIKNDIGLIVIDPLINMIKVKDINRYEEVYEAIKPLLKLARNTETAIIALHHSKKGLELDTDSMLGSQALSAAVETILMMTRDQDNDEKSVWTSQKIGSTISKTVLEYDENKEWLSLGDAKWLKAAKELEAEILNALRENGEMQQTQIKECVQGTRQKIYRQLSYMVQNGKLEKKGDGTKSSPFVYSVRIYPRQ